MHGRLQEAVRSCVQQCQGCPRLVCLVDAYIRSSVDLPIAESCTVNTFNNDYTTQWQSCARNLFPALKNAEAGDALAAHHDRPLRHAYLQLVRRVLPNPAAAAHAQRAEDMPHMHAAPTQTAIRATLRVIAYMEVLQARVWYRWDAVAWRVVHFDLCDWRYDEAQAGQSGSTDQSPFDYIDQQTESNVKTALQRLVDHGILDVHFRDTDDGTTGATITARLKLAVD